MKDRNKLWEEFCDKYGDIKVKFDSYYKFVFGFKGITKDGEEIVCYVGGNSEDIYRYSVDNKEKTIKELEPDSAYIGDKKVWDDPWGY